MTDVFYVKEGSTSPSISTTLLDSANNPADVSDALSIVYRMSGPDEVTGAASFVTDGEDGQVKYDWNLGDLDTWGGYAAEWVVTLPDNVIDIYPSAGYNWVEVMPAATTVIGGACTLLDVRRAMGRALTDAEAVRAASLILSLTATLSRRLNRVIGYQTITDEKHRIDATGVIQLYKHPLVEVTGILVDDVAWTGELDDFDQHRWVWGSMVKVTYTAGSILDAGAAEGVANVVARTLHVAPVVAAGALKSYSVEGTSITYGGGGDEPGSVDRFTVGDLGAFSRLKVPVFRT